MGLKSIFLARILKYECAIGINKFALETTKQSITYTQLLICGCNRLIDHPFVPFAN